jgi:hypothetical protein
MFGYAAGSTVIRSLNGAMITEITKADWQLQNQDPSCFCLPGYCEMDEPGASGST